MTSHRLQLIGLALLLVAGISGSIATAQIIAVAPADAGAEKALADSPRHGEFVKIDIPDSDVKLDSWVVYPERADKAPVVIVIHEIFGLSDWIRSVADHLASQGFIAIAPNMISGMEVTEGQNVSGLIRGLAKEEVKRRLDAARAYGMSLPSSNGKTATIGFCWGGSTSFGYAVSQPELSAAVVYYGSSPATEELQNIKAPVLGLYGENDNRVNATIPDAEAEMKKLGKPYEPHIFKGAGHGFLRQQAGQNGDNANASSEAWTLTIGFLRKHTQ